MINVGGFATEFGDNLLHVNQIRSDQSLSHIWLIATPWTAARQASLSSTLSQSLLKVMSTELVMVSNHLILCCPFLNHSQHQDIFQVGGKKKHQESDSVQFSSVAQSCLSLCDPMGCNMPGLPLHHKLTKFTQTHVHRVSDTIQPSHSLSSPSPAFSLSQYQGLIKWVISLHQVAKVLEFQLQHQSFQ